MNGWKVDFTPDSYEDYIKLDGSQRSLVRKAIRKLENNPLPNARGGYGQELGNKFGINLSGYLKVKLRGSGLRIIYDLKEEYGRAFVIIIGVRADEKVYKLAARRIEKYEVWFNSLADLLSKDEVLEK